MFELQGIDHVALAVKDVDCSASWYIEVLGFKRLHEGMWDNLPVFIGKGETALALFPLRGNSSAPNKVAARIGMLHLAFRASQSEFKAAQRDLEIRGIPFTSEDHGISHSIYFSDPDGIRLEITTYELGPRASGAVEKSLVRPSGRSNS